MEMPRFIKVAVEIKIPIKTTFNNTTSPTLDISADISKANRFVRKIGKLSARYGYAVEVTRQELAPPKSGSYIKRADEK